MHHPRNKFQVRACLVTLFEPSASLMVGISQQPPEEGKEHGGEGVEFQLFGNEWGESETGQAEVGDCATDERTLIWTHLKPQDPTHPLCSLDQALAARIRYLPDFDLGLDTVYLPGLPGFHSLCFRAWLKSLVSLPQTGKIESLWERRTPHLSRPPVVTRLKHKE